MPHRAAPKGLAITPEAFAPIDYQKWQGKVGCPANQRKAVARERAFPCTRPPLDWKRVARVASFARRRFDDVDEVDTSSITKANHKLQNVQPNRESCEVHLF